MKYRIGIDLDDTLWDLLTPWLAKFRELTGYEIYPNDIKSWDIANYVPQEFKETLFNIMLDYPDIWNNVQPKLYAQQVLNSLLNTSDLEVFIVTATDYRVASKKFKRMFELFPELTKENLIITRRKDLINVDLMVDDNPNNLNGNFIGILFDAPHNRNIDKYLRVKSWMNVDELINNIQEKRGEYAYGIND